MSEYDFHEAFARRFVGAKDDPERPALWSDMRTGQIHFEWGEIENLIAPHEVKNPERCKLCGHGLLADPQVSSVYFAWDPEELLPHVYPERRGDLLHDRCIRWVLALHKTRDYIEANGDLPPGRFHEGDLVEIADATPGTAWTIVSKIPTGVPEKGLLWVAYRLRRGDQSIVVDDWHLRGPVTKDYAIPIPQPKPAVKVTPELVGPKLEQAVPKLEDMVRRGGGGVFPRLDAFVERGPLEQERRYAELLKPPAERKKLG